MTIARNLLAQRMSSPAAIVSVFWLAAVVPAIFTHWGLQWPYDLDGFRDVAIAQSLRDGHWSGDPFYAGESAWYSPLVSGLFALLSSWFDLPIPQAYARFGPWVNALGPVAFYLCARRLIGASPAAVATCAFLFLPGRPPAWASGTYSSWPFPAVAAQALFFFGLLGLVEVIERPTRLRSTSLGVLVGLAFVAHAGSGLTLAGIVVSSIILRLPRTPWQLRASRVLLIAAATLAVASPFVAPLALQYGFEVHNRAPATWLHEPANLLPVLRSWLRAGALIEISVAIVGGLTIVRRGTAATATVLASWGAVSELLYLYSLLTQDWPFLPALVPAYHFLFLLRPWKWVLFGAGFVTIATNGAEWMSRRFARAVPVSKVVPVLTLLLGLGIYPRYLGREALTDAPRISAEFGGSPDRAAYEWIRRSTEPSAVFLSSDFDALTIIGPSGRRVVCVDRFFSNPYVEYEPRALARDQMLAALMAGTSDRYEPMGRKFAVSHVLMRGDEALLIRQHNPRLTQVVFEAAPIRIFKILNQ